MTRATLWLLLALLATGCVAPVIPPKALAAGPQATARRRVAITLDDLPFTGPMRPGDTRAAAIDRTISALRMHRAPVGAFVTCARITEDEDLRRWVDAGALLGNHSFSHRGIDDLGLEGWREDTLRCQAAIARVAGKGPAHYRYPFLHTGADLALRDAGFRALDEMALVPVPVTIPTSDWVLAVPYVQALTGGDTALAEAIAAAYVAHVLAATRRYAALADHAGHGDAAHILLLHGNALAADHLDTLLGALEREGFSFVTVGEALAGRLYAEADHYHGHTGLSWLHRIGTGDPRMWSWDAAQSHALKARFAAEEERASFDLDRDLSIRNIAPDVWVVVAQLPVPTSSFVARMPDGTVVLVDPPRAEHMTRALLDWIGARFGPAPLVAVNTPSHSAAKR